MAGISGLMGTAGGASGSGFAAPTSDTPQLNTAYEQTQHAIQQQQRMVEALNAQNGLGNQGQVFRQQQGLADQYQGVINGTGPNPALAQLNQTTGQNVANQAALMAGQRGASANTGLMARQAAQQGAGIQQQAVGQGATLQAQQQLAAMQQLQNQQTSMGNLANTQVNQQQAGLSALNQNSLQQQANLMGLQSNINSANAGLSGASQASQGNMMGNMMGAIGQVGNLFGGGSGSSGGDAFGGLMGGGEEMMDATGGMSDIGDGLTMIAAKGGQVPKMANGGTIDDGNPLTGADSSQIVKTTGVSNPSGPSSKVGQMFNNYTSNAAPAAKSSGGGGSPLGGMGDLSSLFGSAKQIGDMGNKISEIGSTVGEFFSGMGTSLGTFGSGMAGGAGDAITGMGSSGAILPALGEGTAIAGPGLATEAVMVAKDGGKVPALLSPGEKYLSPEAAKAAKEGKVNPLEAGKTIPGTPKVSGAKDSYKNDTVKAELEEGGLVLPRSVTQSKNPEWAAHKFVRAHMMAHGGMIPKKPKSKGK